MFLQSLVGHLGFSSFYLLWTCAHTRTNIFINLFFISLGERPRNWTGGSHDKRMFNFKKESAKIFFKVIVQLYTPTISSCSTSLQTLGITSLFNLANLLGVKWYLIVVLIGIFQWPMIISIFSSAYWPFIYLLWSICFWPLFKIIWVMYFSYILDTNLLFRCFANVVSQQ